VAGAEGWLRPLHESDAARSGARNRFPHSLNARPIFIDQLLRLLLASSRRANGKDVLLDLGEVAWCEGQHLRWLGQIAESANQLVTRRRADLTQVLGEHDVR